VIKQGNQGFDNGNSFNSWYVYAIARISEPAWYTSA